MLLKILGALWILFGLLWLIFPNMLKNRLKKKLSRKIRRVVFAFLIVFGLVLAGSVLKVQGILPKIIGIIGLVLAIKGFMLITSKTSEKFFDWLATRSIIYFRIMALVILGIGIAVVFFM